MIMAHTYTMVEAHRITQWQKHIHSGKDTHIGRGTHNGRGTYVHNGRISWVSVMY